jgi:hypothetical protein
VGDSTVKDRRKRLVSAIGAIALWGAGILPAHAGPDELALLTSYIGEWRGSSMLVGGKKPEPFKCRLSIDKGNQAKINYAGRCTLVSMNLSVNGTIAYDDPSQTYQAIMSSNAGFTGVAVGRKQGDSIVFDLEQKQEDKAGNDVRIGARITLIAQTSITVDYEVEFNNSGNVLTANVPFTK